MRVRTAWLMIQRGSCSGPKVEPVEVEPRVWLCSWCGYEPGDCTCRPPERSEDV